MSDQMKTIDPVEAEAGGTLTTGDRAVDTHGRTWRYDGPPEFPAGTWLRLDSDEDRPDVVTSQFLQAAYAPIQRLT